MDEPETTYGNPKFAIQMLGVRFAVGAFVMDWGNYERFLIRLISDLEDRPLADVKTELLGKGRTGDFGKRLRKVRTANSSNSVLSKLLDNLVAKHEPMVDVRHDIVHGYWSGMDDNSSHVLKRQRKGMTQEIVSKLDATAVLKHQNGIAELNGLVVEILVHIGTLTRA